MTVVTSPVHLLFDASAKPTEAFIVPLLEPTYITPNRECDKKGKIKISSVALTTTLITQNSVTFKDPKSYVLGYVTDKANEKVSEAAAKKSKLLRSLKTATSSAKKILKLYGLTHCCPDV